MRCLGIGLSRENNRTRRKRRRSSCRARGPLWRYRVAAMAKLEFGDTAPDFELPVRGKETVRLSEALKQGPVVLLTYIFDFSPG